MIEWNMRRNKIGGVIMMIGAGLLLSQHLFGKSFALDFSGLLVVCTGGWVVISGSPSGVRRLLVFIVLGAAVILAAVIVLFLRQSPAVGIAA